MSELSMAEALIRSPWLRQLQPIHIAELTRDACLSAHRAGSLIFRQGDPAERIYFVVDGCVALEICAPAIGCRRICTLTEGELLGWSPILRHAYMTATARALTETHTIVLSANKVLDICQSDPQFGFQFMRCAAETLAKRLSATRLQLVNVYGEQMPATSDVLGPAIEANS
jgi:CRP-like cAMP-binding protein